MSIIETLKKKPYFAGDHHTNYMCLWAHAFYYFVKNIRKISETLKVFIVEGDRILLIVLLTHFILWYKTGLIEPVSSIDGIVFSFTYSPLKKYIANLVSPPLGTI